MEQSLNKLFAQTCNALAMTVIVQTESVTTEVIEQTAAFAKTVLALTEIAKIVIPKTQTVIAQTEGATTAFIEHTAAVAKIVLALTVVATIVIAQTAVARTVIA